MDGLRRSRRGRREMGRAMRLDFGGDGAGCRGGFWLARATEAGGCCGRMDGAVFARAIIIRDVS